MNTNSNPARPGRSIPSVRLLPYDVTVNVGLSRTKVVRVNASTPARAEARAYLTTPGCKVISSECVAVTIPSMFL